MMPWLIWCDLAYDLEYLQIPIKISSSGSIESNDWKSGVMLSDSNFGQKFQQLWKFLLHWRWLLTSLAVIKSVLMMRDSLTLWFVLWLVTHSNLGFLAILSDTGKVIELVLAPSACEQGVVVQWLLESLQRERKRNREQRVTEAERERTSSSEREFVGTVVWFCLWLLESPQISDREREN